MHLKNVWYPNDAIFERLVSCCPVLEELNIRLRGDDVKEVYRVHSRSLKRLTFVRNFSVQLDFVPGVVIDAPLLCCLSINDCVSKSFIVKNMQSNAKLDISLHLGLEDFYKENASLRRSSIHSFLPGISKVMDMKISPRTFKFIHQHSKLELLPQFGYMSRLHATILISDLKWLPTFLERCPNLKFLVLALTGYLDRCSVTMHQISFSSVPECLFSSLEFVDIDIPVFGYGAEMKLVKYLLENSATLKKLTLRSDSLSTKFDISKSLLKITRRSSTCQVVVI